VDLDFVNRQGQPADRLCSSPHHLLYLSIVVCVLVAAAEAQSLQWREKAPLSLARAGYMAGVIDAKYVIAGGSYWTNHQKQWTDEVDVYDPATDRWALAQPLPEPRSDAASVVLANRLYLFGGGAKDDIRRDALVFRNGRWQPLQSAELPEPRVYAVATAVKGVIYLLGGMSKHGDYGSLSNEMWSWNPLLPKTGWRKLKPIPGPGLITQAVAALNGRIYVLGGAKTGGKDVVNVNTAFEYNPATEHWTILPALPIERRCWWGLPLKDEILLFGGFTQTNESDVFAYQPQRPKLEKVGEMPHGLCDAKFFRIGDSIYGLGGESAPQIRGRWTLEGRLRRAQ